ncbi:MAG: hypothetical protein ACHQ50_01745 [Fimbriimonadales bacterium]
MDQIYNAPQADPLPSPDGTGVFETEPGAMGHRGTGAPGHFAGYPLTAYRLPFTVYPFTHSPTHPFTQMLTIYKPGQVPVRGLRTSIKGAQLGDGYFQAINNLRWDTGALTVRNGIATVSSSTPGTVCLGTWSGALNGTWYVVSAWVVSGKVGVYSLNLATGAFTEITSLAATPVPSWGGSQATTGGVAAGGTRLGTSTTSPVSFAVHTVPRRVVNSQTVPPVDVLSINNLEDFPLIWNPTQNPSSGPPLTQMKNIATPAGASQFNTYARFSAFLQVAGSAGNKTYTSGPGAQSRFLFADTSTAPYNTAGNVCIKLTNTSSNDQDVTTVKLPSTASFPGEQISFIVEGAIANVSDFFTNAKIEVAGPVGGTVNISGATNANPIRVTANGHGLQSANNGTALNGVTIAGLGGNTNANGTWFASVVDANNFDLYQDMALTIKVAGNSAYTSGGTVQSSPLYAIYDSKSVDPTLALAPISTPLDTGNNRFMFTYSLKSVPASSRGVRWVRFTRNGANANTFTITILAIAGAGNGAGFYGGTEFWMAYSDHFGGAESGGFAGQDVGGDLIKNCGGPSVVTSGSGSIGGTKLPVSTAILYDFSLHVVNPGPYGTLYGGLNGYPNALDLYFRTSAESTRGLPALYWTSLKVYEAGLSGSDHIWQMIGDWSSAGVGSFGGTPNPLMNVKTENASFAYLFGLSDRDLRDPGVPAPSPFNVALPRAATVGTANQRTLAGQIKDPSGSYQLGDLYVSDLGFPFRFVSVQGDLAQSGTRLTFDGEKVMAVVMTAAGANGASIIYVITDQSFNALGTAGGFVGSGYDATSLSTRVRISASGTVEPGSVQEYRGVVFYVDQQGQIIRFAGGGGTSISRNTVDDKSKNIPAAQRGKASSSFFLDRYSLAYTPVSGSANTHLLGWNEILKEWEFDDTLPSTVAAQQIVRAFDATRLGSGQRLLVFSGDGKVYAYEEGSTEPGSGVGPSVELRTREYQTPDLNLFRLSSNQLMIDAQGATLNVDRYYKGAGSQFRTTLDLTSSNPETISLDGRIPTEITATGLAEEGWSGFMDLNGNLATGTVIWRWEAETELKSKGAGVR